MKLNSIMALQHLFDGEVNGPPLALLLNFDDFRTLKLRGAGNGFAMLIDNDPLEEPLDMEKCGKTEVVDVSQSMFPRLAGADVLSVESLLLDAQQVGIRLAIGDGQAYFFWNEDDELSWGDEATFANHTWQNGCLPTVGDRIPI